MSYGSTDCVGQPGSEVEALRPLRDDNNKQTHMSRCDAECPSHTNFITDMHVTPYGESHALFVLWSSLPLVVSFLLQYSLPLTSLYFCGKLGPTELAAASLANCTFNITGLAVFQGLATSLDTLCSQAYGMQKYHLVGIYFQRCSAISIALVVFFLMPLWWNSGTLLSYIVFDEPVVNLTQTYLRYYCLGAPALLFFETGKRYLQAQHIFHASTFILVGVVPICFLMHFVMVEKFGFVGAPLAASASYWVATLLMLVYGAFVGRKCWSPFGLNIFFGWGSIIHLAVPGIIMVEAEYLAFEILTILAAAFGTEALAAQAIAANIGAFAFQLPFAVSVALSTRIGNLMGYGDVVQAKKAVRVAFYYALGISLFNFSWVYIWRIQIAHMFTKDQTVLRVAESIMTYMAVIQICDAFNVVGAGVLRGQGRQKVGSMLNLFCFYVVALPVGYCLAYVVGWELSGLWVGLGIGVGALGALEFWSVGSGWKTIIVHDNV